MAEGERVRLVAHADTSQTMPAGVFERITDDTLDAAARVYVFLSRYFLGGSFLEEAAHADVQTFRVFAEDREVHVFFRAAREGREALVEQDAGARVDV